MAACDGNTGSGGGLFWQFTPYINVLQLGVQSNLYHLRRECYYTLLYLYACGSYVASTVLTADHIIYNIMHEMYASWEKVACSWLWSCWDEYIFYNILWSSPLNIYWMWYLYNIPHNIISAGSRLVSQSLTTAAVSSCLLLRTCSVKHRTLHRNQYCHASNHASVCKYVASLVTKSTPAEFINLCSRVREVLSSHIQLGA